MSRSSASAGADSGGVLALERDRLATVVVVAGTVLAVAAVFLGGFLPAGDQLIGLLYVVAVLLPAIGVVFVLVACWWALVARDADVPSLVEGPPPETGTTRTYRRVGRETEWALDTTAAEWYRCHSDVSTEELRDRLVDGAVGILRSRRGLERSSAREAVRNGTWTDDPVAAAFLSERKRQPPGERLRAAIDPGAASQRRIRRTLAAIERIDDGSRRARSRGTTAGNDRPNGAAEGATASADESLDTETTPEVNR